MALETPEVTRTASTSRMGRGLVRGAAGLALLLGVAAALRAQGGDKAKVSEAVKADLAKLADLERGWFDKNRTFTTDLRALGFAPASGANITMSYASARSWAANASHPTLAATTCFIVVSQPGSGNEKPSPFCSESAETKAATAPTTAPTTVAAAPQSKPAAKTETPKVEAPKQALTQAKPAAPATTAPKGAGQQVVVNRRRRPAAPAPAPTAVSTPAVGPSRAPSASAALSSTRAAGGAAMAGATEAVTPTQFTERLNAFVTSALEVTNAKGPELVRDPYESSAEYQARVAAAMAVFNRRESEFYARSTRTFVVSIPVKGVKYDADREVVDFDVDGITLPAVKSFAAGEAPRLSVACYTRPIFWCGAEGMQYDGTDLWHLPRATARTADVLNAPLTLVARFVVGRRDDERAPAVTLVGMELQAKGAAIARWDAAAR